LKGRWSLLMLVILVLLCAGVAQTSPGHSALVGLGLTSTPPSYTELSFTNAASLQESVASLQAPVTVSFGIHNVSDSQQDYRWSIVALRGRTNEGSLSGGVSVASQARAALTENVQVTCPSGRLEMILRLASPAESLNFWVTCPTGAAGAGPSVLKPGGKKGAT
jgi:hypothetical protein